MNLPETVQPSPIDFRRKTALVPYGTAERPGTIEILGITSIFRRRILMIGCIVAICTLLAVMLTLAMPKQYVSQSDISIAVAQEAELPSVGQERQPTDTQQLDERVETELQILGSRQVAERLIVAEKLGDDPVFRSAVLNPPGAISNFRRAIGLSAAEQSFEAGVEQTNAFRQAAIDYIVRSLSTVQLGKSTIARVTFVTIDPNLSKRLADGLAQTYKDEKIMAKVAENQAAITTLRARMEELRLQAQQDFGAVQRYRIQNNLLSSAATALTESEISTYNQQVAAARAEATGDQARLNAARSQLRGGAGEVGAGTGSAVISSLRTQRSALSASIADMSQRYRSEHPDLVAARRQLADIDQQIDREVSRTIRELEASSTTSSSRLRSLAQSQSSARGTLAQNNNSLIELDGLQRRAQASQELYESYLNRYKATVARSGAESSGVSVLSPARVQTRPVSPNPFLNIVFGMMAGLVLGGLAAIASEANFAGFTTPEDIERKLGLNYVGSLPLLKAIGVKAKSVSEAVRIHPGGMMAESIRNISARLSQVAPGFQVLAVTSAVAGEGKSTLSASLARVLGRAGAKVVVIDCDVARPQLSERAGANPLAPGLRQVIAGEATIEQALIEDEVANVWVLPITSAFPEGERLIQGSHLNALIQDCRDRFDIVILDCSPVLLISESRQILTLADVTLFSVLWRKTRDSTVNAALRLLSDDVLSGLGVVLNKVDIRKRRRFGSTDATFFYSKNRAYYSDAEK